MAEPIEVRISPRKTSTSTNNFVEMHKKLKITLESCLVYASVSSEVQADEQKSPVFHARKMLKGIARLQQLAIRNPFRH